MATKTTAITTGQIRCIYALTRAENIDNDTLHAYVKNMTGKESIKKLSKGQAIDVIDGLKKMTGQKTPEPPDRSTNAQVAKIYSLVEQLKWNDPARLRCFLEKRYGVSHPKFLDDKSTSNCIEALKAILKGGRGERKGYSNG